MFWIHVFHLKFLKNKNYLVLTATWSDHRLTLLEQEVEFDDLLRSFSTWIILWSSDPMMTQLSKLTILSSPLLLLHHKRDEHCAHKKGFQKKKLPKVLYCKYMRNKLLSVFDLMTLFSESTLYMSWLSLAL